MFTVAVYASVRQFVFVEGHSKREAARVFGLARETVDKICRFSVPPGYRRTKPPEKRKLGPFLGVIDDILLADALAPPKQRHTSQRIFERLRDEHGFTGDYTVVKDYVRQTRMQARETFGPLAHPPGHAQVDFGEAVAVIGGVRRKVHVFCLDLPHSGFVKAYLAESTEAFLDGHASAFAFFGRVPQSVLYDNTRIAVTAIGADGTRQRTKAFATLVSHYLYRDRFGRPGKGKVEALVKYARQHFLTPVPQVASLAALNAALLERCRARQVETAGRHSQTITERLVADLAAMRELPAVPLEACDMRPARVSSTALVRYKGADYSVPTCYGFQRVLVKAFVDEVVILSGAAEIARHGRSYEQGAFIYNPLHYLALLERKPGALDQAAPLQDWPLPAQFAQLRRLLEERMDRRGKREFIQVLRLLEVFTPEIVAAAVLEALRLRAISFDAVKELVLGRVEKRPARLDLTAYPHLPRPDVQATVPGDYRVLLMAEAAA